MIQCERTLPALVIRVSSPALDSHDDNDVLSTQFMIVDSR